MLFYKINVILEGEAENTKPNEKANRSDMLSKIEMFCQRHERLFHITASSMVSKKSRCVLCAAVKNGVLSEKTVEEFLSDIELGFVRFTVEEITLEIYFGLLRSAYRNDFISDDDIVIDDLNLTNLGQRHRGCDISYSETIVNATEGQKALTAQSKALLCNASLTQELERIAKGGCNQPMTGHPVHYITVFENHECRNKMLRILLSALYRAKRVYSRRYCEIFLEGTHRIDQETLEQLYESCKGGTVVVSFSENQQENDNLARAGSDIVEVICETMRKLRNNVLTIFCLPKTDTKIKDAILEHLGGVTVVSITEEAAFGEHARNYLRNLAKGMGARANHTLYKGIEEGRGYSSTNLNLMFDEWFDRHLKSSVYTQYADLETANRQVAVQKPKGRAIDELKEMVGLREAKEVIQNALDYYKAQKLFREKGFPAGRPAMHMVFTGNPGTAKTTAARLFAQIMKDNSLLSVGDLHEVGRADLVGKYVGWTAQIVKQKFKAAKGSVLFIDEAYALVDDRDNLYGDEAVNTIVQEMENHREDMIVIFAGYPDKMENFLRTNPGLRSRIAFHVPFADYRADELYEITSLLAGKQQLKLSYNVREKLLPIYEDAMKTQDFGNGRYARNLLEKAIMKQASRLVAMDVESVRASDVATLLPEDFEIPAVNHRIERTIGFTR